MFVLHEIIANESPFRKYFTHINEIINIKTGEINVNEIKKDSIIIIPNHFFGISMRRQ